MRYKLYGISILFQLFQLFALLQCQCPEYFRYTRNDTTGELMGIIEIPLPPQGVPLHLCVSLSIATVLHSKYEGHLELDNRKQEKIESFFHGSPIFYKIYFPIRNPIPLVTSITMNKIQYCAGPPAIGFAVTTIKLEHKLYPRRLMVPSSEEKFISSSNSSSIFRPDSSTSQFVVTPETNRQTPHATYSSAVSTTMQSVTTLSIFSSSSTTESFMIDVVLPGETISEQIEVVNKTPQNFKILHPSKPKLNLDCGINQELDVNLTKEKTIRWPWLAAIFDYNMLNYLCTGILITELHVLTVAHCVKDVPPNLLMVSLGRKSIFIDEAEIVNVDVIEIKVHPNYLNPNSADYDLAVVKLNDRVNYTINIRPICLWMGKKDLADVIGITGYVIGWGSNEERKVNFYGTSSVTIISQEVCRQKDGFRQVTSNQTFCGKIVKDEKGFCLENGGSGLIVYRKPYNRYLLRGMVSLTTRSVEKESCDPKEYVVYVDVAKYITWIRKQIT